MGSFELRELESKLKAGYMNKERAAQLAEKDALKKKEEVVYMYIVFSLIVNLLFLTYLPVNYSTYLRVPYKGHVCKFYLFVF